MDRVDPKSVIAAVSLDTVDGTGRTLAAEVSSGGAGVGVALGSGVFGKVGTYRYHGAAVAVKELKAGADEESIGASVLNLCFVLTSAPCMRPPRAPPPMPSRKRSGDLAGHSPRRQRRAGVRLLLRRAGRESADRAGAVCARVVAVAPSVAATGQGTQGVAHRV